MIRHHSFTLYHMQIGFLPQCFQMDSIIYNTFVYWDFLYFAQMFSMSSSADSFKQTNYCLHGFIVYMAGIWLSLLHSSLLPDFARYNVNKPRNSIHWNDFQKKQNGSSFTHTTIIIQTFEEIEINTYLECWTSDHFYSV